MPIGEIDDITVGQRFNNRRELHDAGVHRALQAGITGGATLGADSIVLSGGYVDDEDHGEVIIYTGHGGQDSRRKQVNDQEFTRQNQALVKSCLEGLPVRVIRGSGHKSAYSPPQGYQYDGLFWVDDYWKETGIEGYQICRFRLVSTFEQRGDAPKASPNSNKSVDRRETIILRIVRDSALGKTVKGIYKYHCQVCGIKLECSGGPYAEAAHIRPLGSPHNGPDVLENLLCLCPNHHVLFDHGGFSINDDFEIIGQEGRLSVSSKHSINKEFLRYHRSLYGF